jgi:hypothetical protein
VYVYTEGDTEALEKEAQWMAFQVLAPAYPGHYFSVRAYEGGFFIRDLRYPVNWGMNCPTANKFASSSEYKKKVVMLFGEWLERANQRRGLIESEEVTHVEGVPDKWQKKVNDGLPEAL